MSPSNQATPPPRPSTDAIFGPGTLWARVREQTGRALAAGALEPIETHATTVRQAGIPFSVRIVSTLRSKEAAARRRSDAAHCGSADQPPPDPLASPAPALRVARLSARFDAVLNRFPVLRHHLLLIARSAEPQERPLDEADFDAVARCLDEVDGLAFYNSGPEAGASQPHRHLQLVPFPLGAAPAPTPIEPTLAGVLQDPGRSSVPAYDFVHGVAPLPETAWRVEEREERLARVAHAMALTYQALAAQTGLGLKKDRSDRPYNLLATRRWVMVVPRSRERTDGVSVNALGFAGALLVRDRQGFETVRSRGPLAVLREVGVAG